MQSTLRSKPFVRALSATLALLAIGMAPPVGAELVQATRFGTWGVETQFIAPDIRPGDDFYRHVNKGWLETARIPAGLPMNGAFISLAMSTELQVQSLLDTLRQQRHAPGTPEQQIADLYASFLDVDRRNALGSRPLQAGVADLAGLKTRRDFVRRMARIGHGSVIGLNVVQDDANPQRYMLGVFQGGLGLPGRDYYLKQEAPYSGIRSAYLDYIAGVFERAGVADGKSRAAAVLAFETELAAIHWTPEQRRDPVKTHHPMTTRALRSYAPGFDWQAFLKEAGYGDVRRVNLGADTAIRATAALFGRTPVETLRAYALYHYIDNHADLLSQEWADAHFDFHMRRLNGIEQQRPLDKQALALLARPPVAEQMGRLYAARYFPPESKAAIDKLVAFLRAAFRDRLAQSEWMDEPTRQAAIAKLDAMTVKIGYPDRWHDFASVKVSRDDLVGNMDRYEQWMLKDARASLKGPVRKWEWSALTMPQVVNAYYNPSGNEIAFPAAILQPPFFDPKADPAVNFGAIGMVIGHEISHGFDDQGNRYDGQGALRNWWSEQARSRFDQRASRLAAQYDQYSPLPGLKLSGQLTLGENIGDMGGVAVAWSGYQRLVASDYAGKAPVIDGLTGNQRFFLGFAQLWRSQFTDGFLRNATLTDPHSPGEFRVNGILRNFGPWYETFGITPDNALYLAPEARVSIW
jgi:putative endopeptidase